MSSRPGMDAWYNVERHDSTGLTRQVWDLEQLLLETNGSDVVQALYTITPGRSQRPAAQVRGGITSFFTFDGIGSSRQLISSAVVNRQLHLRFLWRSAPNSRNNDEST